MFWHGLQFRYISQFSICRGYTKRIYLRICCSQLRPTLIGCNCSLDIEGQDLCSIWESSQDTSDTTLICLLSVCDMRCKLILFDTSSILSRRGAKGHLTSHAKKVFESHSLKDDDSCYCWRLLFYKSLMRRNKLTPGSKPITPFEHSADGAIFNRRVGLRVLMAQCHQTWSESFWLHWKWIR